MKILSQPFKSPKSNKKTLFALGIFFGVLIFVTYPSNDPIEQPSDKTMNFEIAYKNVSAQSSEQALGIGSLLPYFFAAARTGDTEVINEFVQAGIPIDTKNAKGYTALMVASYNGQKDTVSQLLILQANACAEDNRGNTALMAAIFKGELSIARRLMSEDCDENHQNHAGQTPLMYTGLFGRERIKQLLINRGADIALTDNAGNTVTSIEVFSKGG